MDRIDIHVDLDPVPVATLASGTAKDRTHQSEGIRAKIQEVRERQLKCRGKLNSRLSNDELRKAMKITGAALTLLEKAADRTKLSARGFVRTLRLGLSISDLKDCGRIEEEHIAEALSYRSLDRLEQYCRLNG